MKLSDIGAGSNTPLYIYIYYIFQAVIYNYIYTIVLPVLAESVIPYRGYGAAIARGGALSEIFQSNLDFRAQVL